MFEGLPAIGWTAPGLLLLFGLMVFLGKIVPRVQVDAMERRYQAELDRTRTERDKWEQTALIALGVADRMVTQGEVTNALVSKLPTPPREQGDGSGSNDEA